MAVLLCLLVAYAALSGLVTAQPPPPPAEGITVTVDKSRVIGTTSTGLFSGNFDWHLNSEEPPAWVNCSINIMKIDDPKTIYLASQLSPGHLRIVRANQAPGRTCLSNIYCLECTCEKAARPL